MDLFGASMSFAERVGLVLTIAGSLAGIFVLLAVIFKGKVTRFSLFGNEVDLKDDEKEMSPRCKDAVVEVTMLAITTSTKVSYLRTKQVLSEQMYYLEDKLFLTQEVLNTAFRKCLADKLRSIHTASSPDDGSYTCTEYHLTSHKEYHFFTTLVTLMSEDLKKAMRQIFIKNHFSHYDEREFTAYLKEKVDLLSARMLQFLRDLYPSDKMVVPYEQVEAVVFNGSLDEVTIHLEHAFRRAVHLNRARNEDADREEEGMRLYILNKYGVDIEAPRKSSQETGKNVK